VAGREQQERVSAVIVRVRIAAHPQGHAAEDPLKDEVLRSGDREQLLAQARRWLYDHRVLLFHDRPLRELVSAAVTELEAEITAALRGTVTPALWQRWLEAMSVARADGQAVQSWLWASPAKHSTRQISEVFERISTSCASGWRRCSRR
jgi:hypothetical protein